MADSSDKWVRRSEESMLEEMGRRDLPSREKGKHLTYEVVVGETTRVHNACDDDLAVLC